VVGRLDYQGVAFPVAHRIAHEQVQFRRKYAGGRRWNDRTVCMNSHIINPRVSHPAPTGIQTDPMRVRHTRLEAVQLGLLRHVIVADIFALVRLQADREWCLQGVGNNRRAFALALISVGAPVFQ